MSDETKTPDQIPEKFLSLIQSIEQMSVMDLAELVKILEEKFGVSATAPAMMMATAPTGAQTDAEAVVKETFDVELTAAGDQKINVIKAVREITGLGLKEAKDLVEAAPKSIKLSVKKAEADEMKTKLEAVGAQVSLK